MIGIEDIEMVVETGTQLLEEPGDTDRQKALDQVLLRLQTGIRAQQEGSSVTSTVYPHPNGWDAHSALRAALGKVKPEDAVLVVYQPRAADGLNYVAANCDVADINYLAHSVADAVRRT